MLLSKSGFDTNSKIVIVDSQLGVAGWIFWYLGLFGLKNLKVLNGGKNSWVSSSYALTNAKTETKETTVQGLGLNSSQLANIDDVLKTFKNESTSLIDVRTQEEFDGKHYLNAPPSQGQRSGHIKSAVHIPIHSFFEQDGTYKSGSKVSDLLASHNINTSHDLIVYCAVGGRSGGIWFALREILGLSKVRNYSGSWREWSTTEETRDYSVTP